MISYDQLCEALERYNARRRNAEEMASLEQEVSGHSELQATDPADYAREEPHESLQPVEVGAAVDEAPPEEVVEGQMYAEPVHEVADEAHGGPEVEYSPAYDSDLVPGESQEEADDRRQSHSDERPD
jgi:hypothetical protein